MKTKILIGIVFFFLLTIQNYLSAQELDFGFKGGINAAYFQGEYLFSDEDVMLELESKLSTRFSIGGLTRYNFSDYISIQVELLYTTRGVRFNEDVEIRNQILRLDGDVTLTYIEIPLFFRMSTTLPDRGTLFYQKPGFTYNAYAGGSFAYKTNAKFSGNLRGDIFGVDFGESFSNRVWDQFAETDISFIMGAGFEYGVSTRFTFDVRYAMSLLDIGKDPLFTGDIRNGMVSVMMGIVF